MHKQTRTGNKDQSVQVFRENSNQKGFLSSPIRVHLLIEVNKKTDKFIFECQTVIIGLCQLSFLLWYPAFWDD